MICPECKQEMSDGYIPISRRLDFLANQKDTLPTAHSAFGKEYIKISGIPILPQNIEAYYCPSCHFVVIPCKE
ncbi:MAG: PF20097 family protein [Clostridiales bacterium]|jgi:hypothetical protein|nr:PF20097 family protein [Clostridiales bacterium]